MRCLPALLYAHLAIVATAMAEESALTRWQYSAATFGTASVVDAHSSWKRAEMNPLLADSRGQFSHRGVVAKSGVVAVSMGVQYLLIRKWPKLGRPLSYVNFAAAGVTAGVAARNYRTHDLR